MKEREHFARLLAELGVTEQQILDWSGDPKYLTPLPDADLGFCVRPSVLHGNGVFSTEVFEAGAVIGPSRLGLGKTVLGRFVNHSDTPNAENVRTPSGDLFTVAINLIEPGQEILTDYRINLTRSLLPS